MRTPPSVLIFTEFIEPIEDALQELKEIQSNYSVTGKINYSDKGTFVYTLAIFEGALTECLERYLLAFPNKIPKGKLDIEKHRNDLIFNTFSHEVLAAVIGEYLTDLSYEKSEFLIRTYCQILEIPDISNIFSSDLAEKKARRNSLVHNNLRIDNKYIHASKGDPRKKGQRLRIEKQYVMDTVNAVIALLTEFKDQLAIKYGSNTILKAIREIWNYLFDSPMLRFDEYWGIHGDSIYFKGDSAKRYIGSLSSSERTLLCYWIQNYNAGICDDLFEFKDLVMQVSNTRMGYLVSIFDRFPLLLQNGDSTQPISLDKILNR